MINTLRKDEPAPRPVITEDDKTVDVKTVDGKLSSDFDVWSLDKGDLLAVEHVDPVLNAKMHLVNNVSFDGFVLVTQTSAHAIGSGN